MYYPVLYPSSETAFTSRGYGALSDCISCTVVEALNGEYTLELKYPKGGQHEEYLAVRNIIVCSPNHTTEREAFRIYKVNRSLRDSITVWANQLSYDLSGYVATPKIGTTTDIMNLRVSAPNGAIITEIPVGTKLKILGSKIVSSNVWYHVEYVSDPATNGWCQSYYMTLADGTYPHTAYNLEEAIEFLNLSSGDFGISTNKTSDADFTIDMPSSVRSWFGGKEGSLIDIYGGEWEYNLHSCALKNRRGADNGARISYGVNIAQYLKEISDTAYSAIVPYFAKQNGDLIVQKTGDEIATGFTGMTRKRLVDVTSQFSAEYGKITDWALGKEQRKNLIGSGAAYPMKSLSTSTLYLGFNPISATGNLSANSVDIEVRYSRQGFGRLIFAATANRGVGIPMPVIGGNTYRFNVCGFMNGTNTYVCAVYVDDSGTLIARSGEVALPYGNDETEKTIWIYPPSNAAYAVVTFYGTNSSGNWPNHIEVELGAFECVPTAAMITTAGQEWLASHPLATDDVTISVEPEVLATTVSLGDTVHVCYDDAVLDTRVIKTTWDSLGERYTKIELGTRKTTLAETIKSLNSGGIATVSGGSSSEGSIDVGVVDVKVNGTSVTSNGIANINAVTGVTAGGSSVVSGGVAALGNVSTLSYTVISTF